MGCSVLRSDDSASEEAASQQEARAPTGCLPSSQRPSPLRAGERWGSVRGHLDLPGVAGKASLYPGVPLGPQDMGVCTVRGRSPQASRWMASR